MHLASIDGMSGSMPSSELRIKVAILSIFALLFGVRAALPGDCSVSGPSYKLALETVDWQMKVRSGQTCIKGIRFSNVSNPTIKIISPPRYGELALLGPALSYRAKVDFQEQDFFEVEVSGLIRKTSGTSRIRVTVSLVDIPSISSSAASQPTAALGGPSGESTLTDAIPPSVVFTAPLGGATVSGSHVDLTARASDNVAVANVQFIVGGKKVVSKVTSSPYSAVWDSTTVTDGSYTLYAVAQDTSGNYRTCSVYIIVKNK
jgi:hypothetical protein